MIRFKSLPRLILAACFGVLGALPLSAQGPGGHHPPQGDRIEHLEEVLDLTPEQVTQLKGLEESRRGEMEALRASGERPDPETRKAQRDAHRKQMEQILTPAQMEQLKEMRQGRRQEKRSQRDAIKAETLPLVRAQRAQFEEVLSASDKARIAELRAEMDALQPQLDACRESCRAEGGPTEAQQAERKALHDQRKVIVESALEIAKSYEAELKALHEEIKPQLEAVRAGHGREGKGHGHKRGQGHSGNQKGCSSEGGGPGGGAAARKAGHQQHGKGHLAARFILMDPAAVDGSGQIEATLGIFPNPSTSSNTLSYDLPVATSVRIELLSRDGSVQRTLFDAEQAAGAHELKVDLQGLRPDVYYYRLLTPTVSASAQFTLVK